MIKLNLGCEDKIINGFINIDLYPKKKKVMKLDLNKIPYPFNDNYADYILISHVLEHLDNPIEVIKELYRISKDNSIIDIYVPHFSHFTNHADMTHNKDFSYFSFGEEWTNKELYELFDVKKTINFNRINQRWMNFIFNPIINSMPVLYERFLCYILPSSEIHFKLKVIKKQSKYKLGYRSSF